MYIVNRKMDRQFENFDDAIKCAVNNLPRLNITENDWKLKKTPKGWTVTLVNPFKFNHCTYPGTQFIQEI